MMRKAHKKGRKIKILMTKSSGFFLSIINYQLSIINYQLSIINYQLSIINYQLLLSIM